MNDHTTTLSPARRLALDILLDVGRRDAFARDVLNANTSLKNLDERDAGFTRRLVLGVTATSGCLDDFLQQCSDPKTRFNPRVRCALRIALFELLYLDAPANVAVSQGVELVRSQSRGAAGLANAVLTALYPIGPLSVMRKVSTPFMRASSRLLARRALPCGLQDVSRTPLGKMPLATSSRPSLRPRPLPSISIRLPENARKATALEWFLFPVASNPWTPLHTSAPVL